jgi:D-alanyl-D-alanine dipeptidase
MDGNFDMKPADYQGAPTLVENPRHDFVDLEAYPFGLDIRYARTDNFLGRAVYPSEKAFLQRPVADSLKSAHRELERLGFGILVFDGYRPWSVTKLFYEVADDNQRQFLANPERGSVHNRGCAVDCSLFRIKDGREVVMPSDFDEMNGTAWSEYTGGSAEARRMRDLLISTMHGEGFKVLKNEWWHFNHPASADYPIYDWCFDEISSLLARGVTAHR